jgi:hypothetical protein
MKLRLLFLFLLLPGVALAQAPQTGQTTPAAQAGPAMRYFDGRQWRTVWQNEHELAEIVDDQSEQVELPVGAQLMREGGKLHIWKLEPGTRATVVTRGLDATQSKHFAPVFNLSPRGGVRLVLSGNIVIRFKEGWDDTQLEAWAADQGLTPVSRMSLPRTWLFAAADGMTALEKANAIQESGEVEYAIPEWWRAAHKR